MVSGVAAVHQDDFRQIFESIEFCILSLLTQAIWFAHLREDQGLSEQEIYEWCVR